MGEVALDKGAIVPGDPAESEMIRRVTSDDPEYRMPPPDSKRVLTAEQRETLRDWVADGAEYQKHWAFEPVQRARVPRVSDPGGWVRNPIDTFVLDRLNQEGLAPQNAAGKERLLRRATLDLTGLPPAIDEIDTFLNDESPEAYEKAVDRLLASPHYGEKRALEWLDVARYADTHGHLNDHPSFVWPWRDWVIRAFNDNLSYDEFARWQIAGDLLPNPSQDQLVATAFNRLHRQTSEGGIVPEEFLAEYASDRTQTFATAFLGLTMECARCHDHKFDPISQKEYYQATAFFSNIDEVAMYSAFTDSVPTPSVIVYKEGQAEKHQEHTAAIKDAEVKLAEVRQDARERFNRWLTLTGGVVTPPVPICYLPFDYESEATTPNMAGDLAPATLVGGPVLAPGRVGNAITFSGDNSVHVERVGDFDRSDSFSMAMWLRPEEHAEWMAVAHRTQAGLEAGSRGYELMLEGGHAVVGLNHVWPGNAIRVKTKDPIPVQTWTHVTATYDGSSRASGITIYLNGEAAPVEIVRDHLVNTIRYVRPNWLGAPKFIFGARLREFGFKNGSIDEFKLFSTCLTAAEVRRIPQAGAPDKDDGEDALTDHYLARFDGAYAKALADVRTAREAEQAFAETLDLVMVMREEPSSPTAYILDRGAYDRPIDQVTAGTPASVLPFPEDYPRNRLGLANWLVRRDHPLASRVAVNRFWKVFNGRGLVETMEDFGNQGAMPSHPELLDYLAAWFMDNDWDVKALCKLIITSAAYRQDSTAPPDLHNSDPENVLLARGQRHRLSAEEIRDGALAASGLLTRTIGGRSVKPYQPEGLWEDVSAFSYVHDSGPSLYRRSMYTYWKRAMPPPYMLTFNAANRETCVVRREVTITPLQALILLNDPQFVEASRVLAAKVLVRHGADISSAVDEAFRRLTGRKPHDSERAVLTEAFAEQRDLYAANEEDAHAYIRVGEWPVDDAHDPARLAAMTTVVQMVMVLDEFQVKS